METVEFGQLYERYAQDVLRFAFYLTGNHAEAEDITSETFVRAWVESDAIRIATVKAYLFMIARNLHVDWRRRESKRAPREQDPADPAPGPEIESEDRSELRAIAAALQRLPEIDRSALILRAQHGMSYETIAQVLGVNPGAARVKVHRARIRLAELRAGRR
jgi:RNA polymerase sigma-70 factor (ECF subfamily)